MSFSVCNRKKIKNNNFGREINEMQELSKTVRFGYMVHKIMLTTYTKKGLSSSIHLTSLIVSQF